MLRDLLRSRRRPRQAFTDRQHSAPLGVWHDGNSWLGTRTREHRARNGTANRCKQRTRAVPVQGGHRLSASSRHGPRKAGPASPRAPAPGRPRSGRPCAAPHRGDSRPMGSDSGIGYAPTALEPRDGGIRRRRTAPRPERRLAAPARERGDVAGAGSKAKKGFSNFFTSYHLCTANTG